MGERSRVQNGARPVMCRSPNASGSRSSRSAPIAVSARQYQSLLYDLRKHGISIRRSSSQQCNRAAKSRGKRGAGSEVTRDEWWYDERARRCKQSARSLACARLVIPTVYVSPLLQVWRSAAAQSRARQFILQSVVPVSIPWLLSQWRGECLSHVPVVLYPDPHAAPFAPICAASSSVAQRVVERRCLRHPVLTLTAAFKLLGYVLLPLRTVVRQWQQRHLQYTNSAALRLRCTFIPLRVALKSWWSRGLFALYPVADPLYPGELAPLNFTEGRSRVAHRSILRRVPEALKIRYTRVRYTVKFKCVLVTMVSVVHSWWDNHLLPHPADRPHLFAGKYTAEYLRSVRRDFDMRSEAIPPGWFLCLVGCKRLYPSKFMATGGCWCLLCDDLIKDH